MGDESEMMFALLSQMPQQLAQPPQGALASCPSVPDCAKVVPPRNRDVAYAPIPSSYRPPKPIPKRRPRPPTPPGPRIAQRGVRLLQIGSDGVTGASNVNVAYDVFLMLGAVGLVVGSVAAALT